MATTRTVTGFAVNSVRFNEPASGISSIVLVATVTYSDTTTDVVEIPIERLIP